MPFLMNDEDELKKQQEQQAQNLSGQSSIINNNNTPQTKPGAPKSSGSWVNLNQYLDANKENASKMGSTITGKVDGDALGAKDKVESFKSNAPPVVQAKSAEDVTGMLDNAGTTDKSTYSTLKTTGGYSGPSTYDKVDGYQDAATSHQTATNEVKNLKDDAGRQALLEGQYKRPSYSQGMKNFDNLLLQNSADSRKMFEDTSSKWSGIESLLDGATTNVQNTLDINTGNALKNKTLVTDTEKKYLDNFTKPLDDKATSYNTNLIPKIDGIKTDLGKKTLSAEDLAALGLSDGQEIYDLNLMDYLNTDSTEATLDNFASPEQRAQWQALMNLIDGTDSRITSDGKALNPYSLDKDKLSSDLTRAKQLRDLDDANRKAKNISIMGDNVLDGSGGPTEVASVNVGKVLASGMTGAQYLQSLGYDLNQPEIRRVAGAIQNELAFLNHHNRISTKK